MGGFISKKKRRHLLFSQVFLMGGCFLKGGSEITWFYQR